MKTRSASFIALIFVSGVCACGGGSGGDSDGGGSVSAGGKQWLVQAPVTQDGCGERISPVTQVFTIANSAGTTVVDTSLVALTATDVSGGFTAGFDESNGDCTRHYEATFTNVNGGTADVALLARSTCSGNVCENKWAGTAIAQ